MKNLDINEAFEKFFHELEGHSLRSERFYDDCEISDEQNRHRIMTLWAKELFNAGARAIAKDTLETLDDYATSMAGVDAVRYNLTEAFDIAAVDLHVYYNKILPK